MSGAASASVAPRGRGRFRGGARGVGVGRRRGGRGGGRRRHGELVAAAAAANRGGSATNTRRVRGFARLLGRGGGHVTRTCEMACG